MADLMISHSESVEPGVTPPLTMDQRKKPSRQSRNASSTRRSTSSRAEHEQQIGGFYRRADQMPCIDVGYFGFRRQSAASILHLSASGNSRNRRRYDAVRWPHREVTFRYA